MKRFGIKKVRAFLRQSKSRKMLFLEACVQLVGARLLLRTLPFRQLTRIFSFPLRNIAISSTEREQLRQNVCWAVERAANCLPGRTVCFPRGIAAQIMCRKGGIDTMLYYGVAVDPVVGLTAHVWVQDGSNGIIGHGVAENYGVLARFPA